VLAASLLLGGLFWERKARGDRERAERARDELIYSLEVTSAKVEKARRIVLHSFQEVR
jgi:hypothetical protein